MMDRRKTLVVGGGVLVTAVVVGALAGSVGIFGLSDDPPRVGKLSPIDATHSTSVTQPGSDDDTPATTPTTGPGATVGTTPGATPNTAGSSPTTTVTTPSGDDHGGDDHDNRGSGSSHSGDDDD